MLRITLLVTLLVSLLTAQTDAPLYIVGEVVNPPSEFEIQLLSSDTRSTAARTFGRSDGHFNIGPVAPGSYELRVVGDRGEVLHTQTMDASSMQASVQIRLRETKKPERPVSGVVSYKALTKQRKLATKFLMAATDFRRKAKAKEAVEKYEAAIAADPSFAVPHHDLAVHYINMRQPWNARKHLLAAIELDPKLEMAYTNLSIADIDLGNAAGAEISAEHALELNHDNEKAAYLLHFARYMQGKAPRPAPFHKTGD